VALMAQWIFAASLPCIGETEDDLVAIQELLLTLEKGFEEKNVEKYVSVFSHEEYEYYSDMATPDDPADDPHIFGVERERSSAARAFKAVEQIDLEMTDPDIAIIDDVSAEARSEYRIAFIVSEKPNIPKVLCAGGEQLFSLRRSDGKWKIVRWQQYEMQDKELAAQKGEKRENKRTKELIKDLGSNHLGTWAAAMMALGKRREAATDSLIKALYNNDKNIRIRAAKVLYGTKDEEAIQALIRILRDEDDDVGVRAAAVITLSECDAQMVDASLLKAARSSIPELRSAALLALAKRIKKRADDIHRVAASGLRNSNESIRAAAAECLEATTSVRGIDLLEQRLMDRDESEDVRLAALESLKQIGAESTLGLFRDILKDETEAMQIRADAARALGAAKDHQSLELLTDVAEDEEETLELRGRAITALGAIGDPKVVEPLIQLLDSPDERFRGGVVESLAQVKDSRVLDTLMTVLMNKDESIYVRSLAGRGILRIDRDTAFGPLSQIVKDRTESAPARQTSASILTSSRDKRSIPIFIAVLEDEDQHWQLRRIAVNHLKKFASESPPCVDALEAAAGCPDERIAMVAQAALGEMDANVPANP
ncbi:HEAT repeat domain-containing protein, partial [Candidatus Poribacteria bacterium]